MGLTLLPLTLPFPLAAAFWPGLAVGDVAVGVWGGDGDGGPDAMRATFRLGRIVVGANRKGLSLPPEIKKNDEIDRSLILSSHASMWGKIGGEKISSGLEVRVSSAPRVTSNAEMQMGYGRRMDSGNLS